MKGLELSRRFYEEYGAEMLKAEFSDILPFLAVGVAGSGSECFGFDDELSRDHDFEPGFCIFVPDGDIIDSRRLFLLERAYAKLPKEFMGYIRQPMNPVGGNRHGPIMIGDFFKARIGSPHGMLTTEQWFSLPGHYLAEAVNGEIYFDNYGLFTRIREELSSMPEDIRLKKISGNLLIMGQSGQYNYSRCISRAETAAAQLCLFEFTKSAMQVIFLLNRRHMPYYKWSFRALRELPCLSETADRLEYLISSDNTEAEAVKKAGIIESLCADITAQLIAQGITEYQGSETEGHAYSVNGKIRDNNIRNLHILYGV